MTEFKDNGLFTVLKDKNGNWVVSRTYLSQEKYDKLYNIYNSLNKNAFTSQEQNQHDKQLQQALEQKQIKWGTMK